ncbi:efflux RND transporter periplasmic adaptor subunit [Desulforhopalus singaporensis]|uniref:RND family efflux transporter, MFP subunit n=1 Tax=Desulforhopalus singaporensis TaxID=91360 RepID=A0A1H0JAV9_9BACT|nr:efflux RND transporter periplasmic adaptor subunit [Desulforhopalus singaporensis]SDO40888.1 RND family efflux transporter, MFP subunit [Desulforhopalus singaporensis]
MKHKYFNHVIPVIFIFFIVTALSGCEKEPTETNPEVRQLPEAAVTVARVVKRTATNQIELVGTVEAVDRAKISAKISGNIISLPVSPGSRINKDDLLVEISAGEISAQVQQAKAQLEQAERNLAREQKLLLKNAATPESVKNLRDTVNIAAASFRESRTMLNYTRIKSPFAGIVTHKFANAGDLATPGKPLLQIESENELQVLTDIPEALVHTLSLGQQLTVHVPAAGKQLTGVITEISPTSDPASHTSPIKLKVHPAPNLRSGQFARVMFPLAGNDNLIIPVSALAPYGQMERVFVADGRTAHIRLVKTGAVIPFVTGEKMIEIVSGLSQDELVIIGTDRVLENGQPIVVR